MRAATHVIIIQLFSLFRISVLPFQGSDFIPQFLTILLALFQPLGNL